MKKLKNTLMIVSFNLLALLASEVKALEVKLIKEKRSYTESFITTSLDGEKIEAHLFSSRTDLKAEKKILYLTPTISGVSPLEKSLAKYFSKLGYLVIVPLPYKSEIENISPDIKRLDIEFLKPAKVAKNLIDNVKARFHLPVETKIYLLGASQGGFRSLTIASELDVSASWIVTAGADFASIYAYSKVKKVEAFRKNHMRILQLTDAKEYEKYLRENLSNDPALICQNVKTPFVQVIALKDDKVPTANQLKLLESCPAHEVIKLEVGHLSASLSTIKMRKRIHHFFLNH
jgi:hypothetical protein